MVVFPHCKINLGLHILGKRADGFHNLETVFYPVMGLTDILELIPDTTLSTNDIVCSGLPIQGDAANNLCLKAWQLLQADYPDLPPVHLHLHKVIPMGAGLGGGSSDGMFALQLLNIKLKLQLDRQQLLQYAAQLGSDCAFFAHKKPCLGTGRGEILQPIELSLSPYQLVLVHPGIHVNTAWAFSQLAGLAPLPITSPSPISSNNQLPVGVPNSSTILKNPYLKHTPNWPPSKRNCMGNRPFMQP